MKKVYFACSVRGGRGDKDTYQNMVEFLRTKCQVLTEFNVDKDLTPLGTPGATSKTYARDMEMLTEAELMIAEVSTPSLGVGYEIAKAEAMSIPILALYRKQPGKALSAMIDGNPHVQVAVYTSAEDALPLLASFLKNN